jgi:hypothetical protein
MRKMLHFTNRGSRNLVGLRDVYGAIKVKRKGRDVEHSLPSSAGARNMWS